MQTPFGTASLERSDCHIGRLANTVGGFCGTVYVASVRLGFPVRFCWRAASNRATLWTRSGQHVLQKMTTNGRQGGWPTGRRRVIVGGYATRRIHSYKLGEYSVCGEGYCAGLQPSVFD